MPTIRGDFGAFAGTRCYTRPYGHCLRELKFNIRHGRSPLKFNIHNNAASLLPQCAKRDARIRIVGDADLAENIRSLVAHGD